MKSGKVIYKQREIVLTRFPFSNLIEFKVRPVLIISKDSYNRKYSVLDKINTLFTEK